MQGNDIHGRHAKASTTTCSSSLLPRGDMHLRGVTMDCTDMFVNAWGLGKKHKVRRLKLTRCNRTIFIIPLLRRAFILKRPHIRVRLKCTFVSHTEGRGHPISMHIAVLSNQTAIEYNHESFAFHQIPRLSDPLAPSSGVRFLRTSNIHTARPPLYAGGRTSYAILHFLAWSG